MSNNHHITSLTAIELRKICNPITAIAICLQLWRHFLSIFRKRAQDTQKIRIDNTIRFCLEHATYHLLMLGAMSEDQATSIINMTIYKVSIISHINHPINKKTTITFCDLSIKEIGDLRPDVIVDFLMNLVKECSTMIKDNPKGPLFNQYVDYYADSIYDISDIMKKTFYQVTQILRIIEKEEYISGFATLAFERNPLQENIVTVSENMNLQVTDNERNQ